MKIESRYTTPFVYMVLMNTGLKFKVGTDIMFLAYIEFVETFVNSSGGEWKITYITSFSEIHMFHENQQELFRYYSNFIAEVNNALVQLNNI